MLKKIDRAQQLVAKEIQYFACPLCQSAFTLQGYSLTCQKNHRYDLSKKGTLYFLAHQVNTGYTHQLFAHRQRMIQSGMYDPVLAAIYKLLPAAGSLVDVGCGEGSFLQALAERGLTGALFGFDLSKAGVYLASNQAVEALWSVADLTCLPYANQSIDTILNIFSPSHYGEFQRVLKSDGAVVKVIPEAHYLRELRQAFYPDDTQKQTYSNEKVLAKFAQELTVVHDEKIEYTFAIPEAYRLDLLEMSPLEWQVAPAIKAQLQQNPLTEITVAVRLLKGEKR